MDDRLDSFFIKRDKANQDENDLKSSDNVIYMNTK
jgi:hypothetical protein